MLATGQRMRRKDEFTATVRGGRRAGRGALVVHLELVDPLVVPGSAVPGSVDAGSGGPSPVAGFVVPRAVGSAVVRNKVRRRLRHLVRARLRDLPPGSRLVVRALPPASTRSYPELGADLDAALAAARSGHKRRSGVSA